MQFELSLNDKYLKKIFGKKYLEKQMQLDRQKSNKLNNAVRKTKTLKNENKCSSEDKNLK